MSEYPTNRQFIPLYSLRYIKWLCDAGIALEVGPDAFALLVAVVTREDSIYYKRAPNFFNEQLATRCGIGSEPAFIRARKRAINAGLLFYLPGAKRRPGVYYVIGFINESFANNPGFANESLANPTLFISESDANRLPSSPNPPCNPKTNTDDASSEVSSASPRKRKIKPTSIEGFDEWYSVYPKKVGRGDAEKAFLKAIDDIQATDHLDADQARAELMRLTNERLPGLLAKEEQYRKHPARWLNAKAYRDEIGSQRSDEREEYPNLTTQRKRA